MKYLHKEGNTWAECFSNCLSEWCSGDEDLQYEITTLSQNDKFSMDGLTCNVDIVDESNLVIWTWLQ